MARVPVCDGDSFSQLWRNGEERGLEQNLLCFGEWVFGGREQEKALNSFCRRLM